MAAIKLSHVGSIRPITPPTGLIGGVAACPCGVHLRGLSTPLSPHVFHRANNVPGAGCGLVCLELSLRVAGAGFRSDGAGYRIQGAGVRVQGAGC